MNSISVIIPTYNEKNWLPKTLAKLEASLQKANYTNYEIIFVNDGSTDGTKELLADLAKSHQNLVIVNQQNQGRFLTRKHGIATAKNDYILFLDSRVFVAEGAISYALEQMKINPKLTVWNGHVIINYGWNLFARFWAAVTHLAWRKYLSNPKLSTFGTADFDFYPKGTTFFLAPKTVIQSAISKFSSSMKDMRYANDDTAMLRDVAAQTDIAISPGFACTYHYGRSGIKKFAKHTRDRGTVLVDGFFKPGNRYYPFLWLFLLGTPLAVILLLLFPVPVLLMIAAVWCLELIVALLLGVPASNALSLFVVSPLFFVFYGAGIYRGVYLQQQNKVTK